MSTTSSAASTGPNWLGLLKWSLSYSDGTSPSLSHPMSKQDKEWLELVMKDLVKNEPQRISEILIIFQNWIETNSLQQTNEETIEELLIEIQSMIDQIDMANIFIKFGGIKVLKALINGSNELTEQIKSLACVVIGELAQNNPEVQEQMLLNGVIDELCLISLSCQTNKLCVKSLYGISCIIRGHRNSEYRFFSELNGPTFLLRLLQKNDSNCNQKVLFLLNALILSDFITFEMISSYGDVLFDYCYQFLQSPSTSYESELTLQLLGSLTQSSPGRRYLKSNSPKILHELEEKYQRTAKELSEPTEDQESIQLLQTNLTTLINQVKESRDSDVDDMNDTVQQNQNVQTESDPVLRIGN